MKGRRGAGRLAEAAATVAVAFVACFCLLHSLPGDPLDRLDSPTVPAEQAERTRRALGLDRPLPAQLLRTVAGYLTGDFGASITQRRPVADVIADALPATVALGAAALALGYGLGALLAIGAAALPPVRARRAVQTVLTAAAALPRFWLGVMFVLVFHGWLAWFPASHRMSPGGGDWRDRLWHLVLPALTLGLPAACNVARYLLAAMEVTRREPYVTAARAAGAGGAGLLLRHVLRPSAGPTLTLLGLDLPVLVSGAMVVEAVFAWPGIGRLTVEAVLGGDYPLALAAAALSALVVVGGRCLSEALADRAFPARGAVSAERPW